jgi:putative addiction module component (TIGR02574 family)
MDTEQQKIEQYNFAHLSAPERILLAQTLWDSVHDEALALTDAQKEELDRRIAMDDAGLIEYSPWEEVKKRLDEL